MFELGKLDLIELGKALFKRGDRGLKVYLIVYGSFKRQNYTH